MMVCLLGLKMIVAMPVADHHEGHAPLPVVPLEKDASPSLKTEIPQADVAQSTALVELAAANQPTQAEPAAATDTVATRSSEEVQPIEKKDDELPQPELPKAIEEPVALPKSSEEQIDSSEEEPKVLATAEAEKKEEQESLKEAASETKESVQPVPQPAEIPAENKAVSSLFFLTFDDQID